MGGERIPLASEIAQSLSFRRALFPAGLIRMGPIKALWLMGLHKLLGNQVYGRLSGQFGSIVVPRRIFGA